MRRIALLAASAACCLAANAEVKIDNVTVRQMWPWSTKVKVSYDISGVTDPLQLSVKFYDGETELSGATLKNTLFGDVCVFADGSKSFTFDPARVFAGRTAVADLRVELAPSDSATQVGEVLYRIYDFRTKSRTDVTRGDLLNGKYGTYETDYKALAPSYDGDAGDVLIWTGVTNGLTYKTDKIVFRKIAAKGKHFQYLYGDVSFKDGAGADSWFSHDFWIGVFELTQTQFIWIKNHAIDRPGGGYLYHPYHVENRNNADKTISYAYETNALYSAARAQTCVTDWMLRDTKSGCDPWPKGKISEVYPKTWIPAMRDYFSAVSGPDEYFDMPTSAQWEYAARGGTTTNDLYTGEKNNPNAPNYSALRRIGSFTPDLNRRRLVEGEEPRNTDLTYGAGEVGRFIPNAYGLYDVLGNVSEMCLDGTSFTGVDGGEDPKGGARSDQWYSQPRLLRGLVWHTNAQLYNWGRSGASATCEADMAGTMEYGVRLVIQTHDF